MKDSVVLSSSQRHRRPRAVYILPYALNRDVRVLHRVLAPVWTDVRTAAKRITGGKVSTVPARAAVALSTDSTGDVHIYPLEAESTASQSDCPPT